MINIQTKMKIHRSLIRRAYTWRKICTSTSSTHTHKCLASSQMILMEEKKKISSTTTTMIINGNMLMMMIMMIVVGKIPEKNFAILFTPHMWLFFFLCYSSLPNFFFLCCSFLTINIQFIFMYRFLFVVV